MADNTTEAWVTLTSPPEDGDPDIDIELSYDPDKDEYTFVRAESDGEVWESLEDFESTGYTWVWIEEAIAEQIGYANPLYIGR